MIHLLRFSPFKLAFLITLGTLVLYAQRYESLTFLDKKWTDFQQKFSSDTPKTDRVFIAAVDSKSVDHYGRWPWPRSRIASLIKTLNDYYGVRSIGVDILFSENESNRVNDEALGKAIQEAGNVTLGYFIYVKSGYYQLNQQAIDRLTSHQVPDELLDQLRPLQNKAPLKWNLFKQLLQQRLTPEQYISHWQIIVEATHLHHWNTLPLEQVQREEQLIQSSQIREIIGRRNIHTAPLIKGFAVEPSIERISKNASGQGFINAFQDFEDGVLRRVHLVMGLKNELYTSLDLQILKHYLGESGFRVEIDELGIKSLELGSKKISLYKDGSLLLNFKGPRETFETLSVYDIMERRIPQNALRDRIALVGITEVGLLDSYVIPLGGDYPGVEFHATVLDNLLSETYLHVSPSERWNTFLLLLVMGLGLSFAASRLSYFFFSLTAWGGLGTLLLFYYYQLHYTYTWHSTIYVILLFSQIWMAHTIYAFFRAEREKRQEQREREKAEKKALIQQDVTERQMAGGFAHEIRNALIGAKLIVEKSLGYTGPEPHESLSDKNCAGMEQIFKILRTAESPELPRIVPIMKEVFNHEEQIDQALNLIHKSTSRALRITAQIMDYSKISEDKKQGVPLIMDQLLEKIIEEYSETFKNEMISIHSDLKGEGPLLGVPDHLRSVIENILLNAKDTLIEKGGTGLRIEISSRRDKFNYIVSISDNGTGIKSEDLPRIFDAFFSTKPESGTGLGLGVARKIVLLYKGQIDVKTEVGQGTTFLVSFPL
ncbi:CHASE2 domain-containing protein [Deltaproteobacteria bacterium TL4]